MSNPRVLAPDDERDLLRDPDTLECLSENRLQLLKRIDALVRWVPGGQSNQPWPYAPSWANAVLDELGPNRRRQYAEQTVYLLRRAKNDPAVRDAVIAAVEAGDGLVLQLVLQQAPSWSYR